MTLSHSAPLGLVLRVAALRPDQVKPVAIAAKGFLATVLATKLGERPFVHHTQVVIPRNASFLEFSDCGGTRQALVQAIQGEPWARRVSIQEYGHGDPYGSMPNLAMAQLQERGCRWGAMLGLGAEQYWDDGVCQRLVDASRAGASAIGVAVPGQEELTSLGIVSNHFALYKLSNLQEANGFIPLNHPILASRAPQIFVTRSGDQELQYPAVGGEEGPTCALLAGLKNKIAFVRPSRAVPRKAYADQAWQRRQRAVAATKRDRTLAAIMAAGLEISNVPRAVMGTH